MGSHKKQRKRDSSSSSDDQPRSRSKQRKHVTSSSDSTSSDSSSSSSSSSTSEEELRVRRKRAKKHRRKVAAPPQRKSPEPPSCDIPLSLMDQAAAKAMAPITKDEWDKQQSVIRKVFDPTSGRHRLIKGDGEVIEEIVSRDRHKQINEEATRGDGDYFQAKVLRK